LWGSVLDKRSVDLHLGRLLEAVALDARHQLAEALGLPPSRKRALSLCTKFDCPFRRGHFVFITRHQRQALSMFSLTSGPLDRHKDRTI
jgi:hypothetical protein